MSAEDVKNAIDTPKPSPKTTRKPRKKKTPSTSFRRPAMHEGMNLSSFFDNLKAKFTEDMDEKINSVDVTASVYRDENGEISEIRIFNEEYEEFLVIERDGTMSAINVKDFQEGQG
jgi:hypothetical protein